MRFEEAYSGWEGGRLRQDEAARLLGICERTFRRYVERYEDRGIEGLIDKRLGQVSGGRAPVDEVLARRPCSQSPGWQRLRLREASDAGTGKKGPTR